MKDSRGAAGSSHLHFRRWFGAALLSSLTFAGVLLPLQAAEILHFRIYEVLYDPAMHFGIIAGVTGAVSLALGLAMGGIGFFRETLLNQKERPWPWWFPVAATVPAALACHVLDSLLPAALPLLCHIVAGARTPERRWVWLGALSSLSMALALSNPARYLYAERVVRIFHYHRQRYMDPAINARRPGQGPKQGENYLPSIEALPLQDGELFWLGIYSITHDPWGNPYHFNESRWVAQGHARPDFGRWDVDYSFLSLGADGRRGGSGSNADILLEHVIPPEEVPPERPEGWDIPPAPVPVRENSPAQDSPDSR